MELPILVLSSAFLSPPAGMLVLGLGANQILAEELSNKTSPPREGSILNEGPVLHLSDEGLIASQPGEAPSNSHTAKWRIYTDMGRDLFSKVLVIRECR